MKIDSTLLRLEKRAKRTLRCDWCRFALHDTPPAQQKKYAADPQSRLSFSCNYCGTEFGVDISGNDEFGRDATILNQKASWGAVYRDERVFAATRWLIHQTILSRWRGGYFDKERAEARKKEKDQKLHQQRFEKKKEDRFTRERKELRERALEFLQQMSVKQKKQFAPPSFPLAAELEVIEKPDSFGWIPGTYKRMEHEEITARRVLYSVHVMEACERVLWKQVLPKTESALQGLRSIIEKFQNDRAQINCQEEEEKSRQEAKRESENMQRLATAKPDPPQPQQIDPSPFCFREDGTLSVRQRQPEIKLRFQPMSKGKRYK